MVRNYFGGYEPPAVGKLEVKKEPDCSSKTVSKKGKINNRTANSGEILSEN